MRSLKRRLIKPYYKTSRGQLYLGRSLRILKTFSKNSVDAVVTDPPYGLSFMNRKWDYDVPSIDIWRQVYRILKPGGYLLSFAGTRTYHRMAYNIEDAGFEIRDMCAWVYGSGFPKSLNIGKAVDELQGNERKVIGKRKMTGTARKIKGKQGIEASYTSSSTGIKFEKQTFIQDTKGNSDIQDTKGNSEWEGWGTALKPAMEPIVIARKPLSEKTVVENVLKWKTGGINIDECRIATKDNYSYPKGPRGNTFSVGKKPDNRRTNPVENHPLGRFPANLIHDGSDEVLELFPRDSSSAARFFYTAKASKSERNMGCDELEDRNMESDGCKRSNPETADKFRCTRKSIGKNFHPTVKPVSLMRYLIKLVSREDAIILDPFIGSGTTAIACEQLHRKWIGIEREEEYCRIAAKRIYTKAMINDLF